MARTHDEAWRPTARRRTQPAASLAGVSAPDVAGRGTTVRIRACKVDELGPGEARRVEGDHDPVAVYNVDGEFFALDDTCSHEKFPLTDGWIDGDVVECALHMAKFCIRTGKALCLPANRNVASHAVEVIDGEVWIVTNAVSSSVGENP